MQLSGRSDVVAVYKRLFAYMRPHWAIMALVIVPAAVYAILNTTVPLVMKEVMERLEHAAKAAGHAWEIPVLIAVVFPLRAAMDFLTIYGLAWVGRSVIRDLRNELFAHYLSLPTRFFDQGSSGAMISKITYNTEQVADAISNAVVIVLRDTLAIVLLVAVMLRMSPRLTLLVLVVGPAVGFVIGRMSKAFRRYSTRIQTSMGDVTKVTEESLHGQRIVKVFGGQEHEKKHFAEIIQRNFRFNVRLVAVQAAGDNLTAYTVVLGVCAVMYLSFNDLSAPAFIGFVTAMAMVLTPLKRLINVNAVVQRGIAAAAGLFEILDEPSETDTGTATIGRAHGDVEYRNVAFAYAPDKPPALRGVSLRLKAGIDRRARRPIGQRQVDHREPAAALLRARQRRGAARRPRHPRVPAARPAPAALAREPGRRAVRRQHRGQHRVRRARELAACGDRGRAPRPRTWPSSRPSCRKGSRRASASAA